MDILGTILWFSMFLTPVFAIPIVWKISKQKPIYKLIISIVISAIISFVLYFLSLVIIFRDGMGPS